MKTAIAAEIIAGSITTIAACLSIVGWVMSKTYLQNLANAMWPWVCCFAWMTARLIAKELSKSVPTGRAETASTSESTNQEKE